MKQGIWHLTKLTFGITVSTFGKHHGRCVKHGSALAGNVRFHLGRA